MVQVQIRLSGFCTGRASARTRVRAQPQQYKQSYNSVYNDNDMAGSSNNSIEMNFKTDMIEPETESEGGNRVLVVVDFSPESKNALEWALSHTVQTRDTVSLLLVTRQGANWGEHGVYELLHSMEEMCAMRRPGVHVEATLVEGKERGLKIVEEAKMQRASLLILGQKKRTLLWRLRSLCTHRRKTRNSIVEYCIHNANCMTIAVRRKSRKYGGYLITTKRYKNFWLLA